MSKAVIVPESELIERFSRSSGPGGQGVNTTDSRVELRWDVAASPSLTDWQRERVLSALESRIVDGVLVLVASEQRSQLQNREAARARLQNLLADALRPPPPPRRPTRPSRGAKERRLDEKKQRGQIKNLRSPPTED